MSCRIHPRSSKARTTSRKTRRRRGAYLVLFGLSMAIFLGIMALIHDLALISYGTRQCQNIADAAVLAGSRKLGFTRSQSAAKNTALQYLTVYNRSDSTIADIHTPPISGEYAGQLGYIQVIAKRDLRTWMLRSSWFSSPSIVVSAQSVAGDESFIPEPSLIALNPNARPGLTVSSTASLRVTGRVFVNSEGGGFDQSGNPIGNGNTSTAIAVNTPSVGNGLYANMVDSVGGVDNPYAIRPLLPDASAPLRTGLPTYPDPYVSLATPNVNNGVDNRFRGSVTVTTTTVNGLAFDTSGQNRIARNNEIIADGLYTATAGDVILHPGIYTRIWVTGGRVYFVPGIYVVTARATSPDTIRLSGGTIFADGVMLYSTGENYNANTGSPDNTDAAIPPPTQPSTTFSTAWLNTSMVLGPIDTAKYNYGSLYPGAKPVSSEFNGISFYQRRHNPRTLLITGNTSEADFKGVFYGKWMQCRIQATGTLGSKFFVSDMIVLGGSSINLNASIADPQAVGRSIFLVE